MKSSSEMQFHESEFSRRLQASETLAVTALVAELRRQGKTVIDLGAGEPDFDTPDFIKAAGVRAIEQGKTKYTPNVGTMALREAICRHLKQHYGADYEPKQIVTSNGAKQAIHNTLLAICDPGDEVIIPSPYWVSYPQQVKMASATPVFLPGAEENNFKITAGMLAQAMTPKTKAVILNSPSNPTGTVYSTAELKALAEVIADKPVYLISDEIYLRLVYGDVQTTSMAAFDFLKSQLLLINGFSKAYAMTGWRLGYLAAPLAIAGAVAKIQSHTTSNPSSISQEAGLAALEGDEEALEIMRQEFERRRNFIHAEINQMPGMSANLPGGAFYIFCNVSRVLGRKLAETVIDSPSTLCRLLVGHAGVAMVGGEAFGSREHVRISYATSMQNLQEAMQRMRRTFEEIMR